MHIRGPKLQLMVAGLLLLLSSTDVHARRPAAGEELNRIVNESASFLKNREPEMTASEYALYEKVVAMLSIQPEFAMQLLQSLMSGKERPSPAFEFVLGNAYYNSNRPDLAEEHYRRALERYPDYQRAWCNLGVLHYSKERFDQAVPCFSKAVALGDCTSETLGLLAYSLQRTGNSVAAEMAYLRALSAAPENADWIEGLLGIYLESRQFGRAESLGRQLLRLQPKEARHWLHFAGLLVGQERRLEAIVVLESAKSLQVADPEILLLLGDLYVQQKFFREAVAAYREVLQRTPDVGVKRLLGYVQMLVEEGQFKSAAEVLASVEPSLPAALRGAFLQTRAELAAARDDWPAARRDLEELVAAQPLHGPALLRLGQVLKSAKAPVPAEQAFLAAAQRPDTAYRAHLELADLALRDRHFRQCIVHLELALGLEKSPAIQEYLTKIRALASQDEYQQSENSR